jgi:hypothetical protein
MEDLYLPQPSSMITAFPMHSFPTPVPRLGHDLWRLNIHSAMPCFTRQSFFQQQNADLQNMLLLVLFVTLVCFCLIAMVPIICCSREEAVRIQMISLYAIVVVAMVAEFMAALHYLQDLNT